MLGHKSSLSKFFESEIISNNFSFHNAIRLEVITGGTVEVMKIKHHSPEWWVSEEIKKCLGNYQNLWDAAKAMLRGTFIAVNAYNQESRKVSKKLTLCPKELGKQEQTKQSQ